MFASNSEAAAAVVARTPRAADRGAYLARTVAVYLRPHASQLAFWYETPELNERALRPEIGEYYMTFSGKAGYSGPFAAAGVPLLDYRGDIGRQYNPIAIAQYGLACFNRYCQCGASRWRHAFLNAADWLTANLARNRRGVAVWMHHFDWPYRETLVAPWYSGLAQGQGISLLVRAGLETGVSRYYDSATTAYAALMLDVRDGGVAVTDDAGGLWMEEYIVNPPSHILNGFVWALWGVFDFMKWSGDAASRRLFARCAETIERNLPRYDTGFWSLYELSDGGPPMLASLYYHKLHIVQLRVLEWMTNRAGFGAVADRWAAYASTPRFRARAFTRKAWFKLWHY